ncbi:COG1361 family protein [Haloplanus aerogenes]|uniref:CARDB domain-containing protein n=1 Tax=Haloplanus aerogenes TaxID=660522 RepID=A0A3M0DRE0_9EURY|nr:hypothetical protein [Haloplanus aerogenes]AZH24342.1 hypothetical protein DU502_02650 [Haloplanus aerogenes]RMB24024.1 hypothetical protein ATH50_1257 [Haloplanus aerogenes]
MPDGPRFAALILVIALTVGAVAVSGSGVTTAASSQVVVQSTTIDPTTPRVGEDVTITASLRNFESSPVAAEITQVTLRRGNRIVETVDDPGTLGPGGTMELPLTTTFESPGQKRLTVWVYGQSEGGGVFNVKYPVAVSVEERGQDVQLSLSAPSEPATETQVNVTVANGADTNISNLELQLAGPNATVEDARRVNAALGGGSERVLTYDVTFDTAGRQALTATLDYRDSDGDGQTVSTSRTFAVERADVDAELDAEVVRENDTARIDASVTNFGNVPLERVRIRAEADGETVARKLVSDMPTETTRTVSISESRLPAGPVRLYATYEADGERYERTATVDFAPTTHGNITLTGIEVVPSGSSIRLVGSASNTGETDVTGAVVAVVGTDRVTPVAPAKNYFVGNVPAGEFTSFELTARLAGNRTDAVPVRITYIADGEQHRRVVDVSITGGSAPPAGPTGPGGAGGPPGGGGFLGFGRIDVVGIVLRLALVVAVGGGVVYWWQRRRRPER